MPTDPTQFHSRRKEFDRIIIRHVSISPFFLPASGAAIYIFQDYITSSINSNFCEIASILEILSWAFPKYFHHCMIALDINSQFFGGVNIVILLDVYILICWIVQIVLCFLAWVELTEEDFYHLRSYMENPKNMVSIWIEIPISIIAMGLGGYIVFIFPNLVPEGGFILRNMAMLSTDYGLGPALQAFMASGSVIIPFLVAIRTRARFLK